MPGFDLDRYRDLKGVKGLKRVTEGVHVTLTPIHHEAPPPEKPKTSKPKIGLQTTVIMAPPKEEPPEKPKMRADTQLRTTLMTPSQPKTKKPMTMADISI